MNMVKLADVSEAIDYGVTASASDMPIGPKFLRITDIRNGTVNWESVPYCDASAKKLSASELRAGDIVFARTGTIGKSFLIRECPEGSVFASYLIRIRPGPKIDPHFLSYFFDSPSYWAQIASKAQGAVQPGVNSTKLKELKVPLPPLEDQKRIARILDQADALRRLRQTAITKLNALGQSIFYEMFGDLIANERGFKPVLVGDVIEGFETGKNLAEDPDARRQDGYRILKISAVTSGTFKPEESKPLPLNYEPPAAHIVRDGDLLFSRANTAQLIGATAFVRTKSAHFVLPDKLWRFIWKRDSKILPVFVKALFSSPAFRYEIGKRSSGTSGSMKNISKRKVMTIPLGLPNIELQQEFSRRVSVANGQADANHLLLEMSEKLFASLQHRAFKGNL